MTNRLASQRARICSSTRTIRSTGGSGGPRRSPRRSAVMHQSCCRVGYAACHWCHVMAHESFEDEATAAYMNEHFVSIKVDREERPDVDAVYMEATTAMTGQGGWPMTVVLDHDGEPFFAGTYFPDRPRHGQPAFRQVLEALTRRVDEPARRGREVAGDVARAPAPAGRPVRGRRARRRPCSTRAVPTLAGEFDARPGPASARAPKFPPSMVLEFLLRHAARTGSRRLARMVDETLRGDGPRRHLRPARRRLRPLLRRPRLGGAALREDALRQRPAARRLRPLVAADRRPARRAGRPGDRRLPARASCAPTEGGFASALDADSEGVEGRFYVWTPAELAEVLGADDGAWAAELLRGHRGRHLRARRLHAAAAAPTPTTRTRWASVRDAGCSPRGRTRVRPARDDKVVAAWNGLAIASLAEAGVLLGEPRYVDAARRRRRGCSSTGTSTDGRLRRVSRDGRGRPARRGAGGLRLRRAAGSSRCSQATGDAAWLRTAGDPARRGAGHVRAPATAASSTPPRTPSALVARPRDPVRQRQPVRPVRAGARAAGLRRA